ncbi:GPI inositol-deacylase [Oxalobacteraceae bacterium OTU3REALA1]|nr:GPI inositol-deacylase [Oxalobacteraceae bacterium OTU3REALA1]
MATSASKKEPTRPIPVPYDDNEGNLRAFAPLSPKANGTRARIALPPAKVMPVIVIAGIMGSNLRVKTTDGVSENELKPGESAWAPPNGLSEGLDEAKKWKNRSPAVRQRILNGESLEVDPSGLIYLGMPSTNFVWDEKVARERGWGEIHASSYGTLLIRLQQNLNTTFRSVWGNPMLEDSWHHLNLRGREKWGIGADHSLAEKLTIDEMKKFAEYHYPVYAFGYNWLKSNESASNELRTRIEKIIAYWKNKKRECSAVILVTHSMGGLVARACAKQIPEKVVGIIHGVMPALGAPACYRRLACGTESNNPSNGWIGNISAGKFAEIAGETNAETTPVLSTAAGPLELLPNHLYPKPWLFVETKTNLKNEDLISLPKGNPYDFYRDFRSWYRIIDPALADPAHQFSGKVDVKITKALDQAQKFHMDVLNDYYHPNTFAFYGNDKEQLSFGSCRWKSKSYPSGSSERELESARHDIYLPDGGRRVKLKSGLTVDFVPGEQDAPGDGTVPPKSGAGPDGKIRYLFRTAGYSHQGSYADEDMLALTQHLIVRLMQKI